MCTSVGEPTRESMGGERERVRKDLVVRVLQLESQLERVWGERESKEGSSCTRV